MNRERNDLNPADEQRESKMKKFLSIPNILSLSRLVLLPVLFILVSLDMKVAFVISYAIIGSTDMFDGWVARKFNMRTDLGKALDSIADLPFYISTAYFLYKLYPEYLKPNAILLYIFFSVLALSFVVSAIRCKKPIMMHTFLLKLNAVLIYFLVVFSLFTDTTYFISLILFIYYIGFAEEIFIFIKYGEVDPDTPSVFTLRNRNKPINNHPQT